jgi:hypothetical protein
VPTCLFWCLWREINDKNFEDRERTPGEIQSLFYKTLDVWTTAYVSPLSLSHGDSLVRFAPSS